MADITKLKEIRKSNLLLLDFDSSIRQGIENLPLLDSSNDIRSSKKRADRALCIHAVAAVAYGFCKIRAINWIFEQQLKHELSPLEYRFLQGEQTDSTIFRNQIESNWALAWTLGLVDDLDFTKECSQDFVEKFPDLMAGESGTCFYNSIQSRNAYDIFKMVDLAYCIHYINMELALTKDESNALFYPFCFERRKALDWVISNEKWDEMVLDT